MASSIPLFIMAFVMLMSIMGGAIFLNAAHMKMTDEILTSQNEIMGKHLKSDIKILDVSVVSQKTYVVVLNNGSVSLDTNKTFLFVNSIFADKSKIIYDVSNTYTNSSWPAKHNITIIYDKELFSGDKILVVCETGKKANTTIV
ncbi:MAG: hypothetical protein WC755_09575 [Candidatus Woesearchaeota archaeon]|jgi:archaellum component FlaF (FlaF/FlaG flagellin family)